MCRVAEDGAPPGRGQHRQGSQDHSPWESEGLQYGQMGGLGGGTGQTQMARWTEAKTHGTLCARERAWAVSSEQREVTWDCPHGAK